MKRKKIIPIEISPLSEYLNKVCDKGRKDRDFKERSIVEPSPESFIFNRETSKYLVDEIKKTIDSNESFKAQFGFEPITYIK